MQQNFDDNGMVENAPIRITFKDIESGTVKSEDVPYSKGSIIMIGKRNKNDMVNLPKAGWIKSSAIFKFSSVQEKKKETYYYEKPLSEIHKKKEDMSIKELHDHLNFEIKRLSNRTERTGLPDPRISFFRDLVKIQEQKKLVDTWNAYIRAGK